jgi:hypothetical protein
MGAKITALEQYLVCAYAKERCVGRIEAGVVAGGVGRSNVV